MKKIILLIVWLVSLCLFLKAANPLAETGSTVQVSEPTGSVVFVSFVIFLASLFLLHSLLSWWVYGRGRGLDKVKLLD